jgi:CRP/FNR family transcriptional regulator, nitrogen fixation regulation protein
MFNQFAAADWIGGGVRSGWVATQLAQSGELAALAALETIGSRRSFARGEEIYAETDSADCWYKVTSGTIRIGKLLADGRRHIAAFCLAGDCFGLDTSGQRIFFAEAVDDANVMRFPRAATERVIDRHPELARHLCEITLRDLAHAQTRMLMLGRMTAPERVAHFLLELAERRGTARGVDVPMSRNDIADYLGLTIETVCRVLSALRRDGTITTPGAHRIEFRDRAALEAGCEA